MNQGELLQKAERYFPGACLGMMSLPPDLRMVMVRGHGSKLYDAAGNEYLDYMLVEPVEEPWSSHDVWATELVSGIGLTGLVFSFLPP
jgi:hypothetical protein